MQTSITVLAAMVIILTSCHGPSLAPSAKTLSDEKSPLPIKILALDKQLNVVQNSEVLGAMLCKSDASVEPIVCEFQLKTLPIHGHLDLTGNPGEFLYTPQSGFSGLDSFTYTAISGEKISAAATVKIKVNTASTNHLSLSGTTLLIAGQCAVFTVHRYGDIDEIAKELPVTFKTASEKVLTYSSDCSEPLVAKFQPGSDEMSIGIVRTISQSEDLIVISDKDAFFADSLTIHTNPDRAIKTVFFAPPKPNAECEGPIQIFWKDKYGNFAAPGNLLNNHFIGSTGTYRFPNSESLHGMASKFYKDKQCLYELSAHQSHSTAYSYYFYSNDIYFKRVNAPPNAVDVTREIRFFRFGSPTCLFPDICASLAY